MDSETWFGVSGMVIIGVIIIVAVWQGFKIIHILIEKRNNRNK